MRKHIFPLWESFSDVYRIKFLFYLLNLLKSLKKNNIERKELSYYLA